MKPQVHVQQNGTVFSQIVQILLRFFLLSLARGLSGVFTDRSSLSERLAQAMAPSLPTMRRSSPI
jgi:hypothetical protein